MLAKVGYLKKSLKNEGTNIKGYPALPRVNGTSGYFGMQKDKTCQCRFWGKSNKMHVAG